MYGKQMVGINCVCVFLFSSRSFIVFSLPLSSFDVVFLFCYVRISYLFASYSNIQIHHLIAHVLVCFLIFIRYYFRVCCVLKYLSHLFGGSHISSRMILINSLTKSQPATMHNVTYFIRSARPANLETEMKNKTATKRKYK